MCGISGYFKSVSLDGQYASILAETLAHRGPDHTGFFEDDKICLAHNRLRILDLSDQANQPFHSQDGKYVLVYNGEIYNYKELAQEMNLQTRTQGDTEVVIEAYAKWGDAFVDKLNGMFAIAIYNREDGTLKLWRDRFGIKPLCYYWDGIHFAFASELKALYQLPLNKELNQQSLGDYLFLEYIPQPDSIFQNFHKLGPGQQLNFKDQKLEIKTYYNLLDKVHSTTQMSSSEALEKFEDLFHQSLKYRMIADVPVGAFLSGGIDSTSICLGLSEINQKVQSFNIGFDEAPFDEAVFAQMVAKELGNQHLSHQLRASDLLDSMDAVLSQYDEPFAVSSVFPTNMVSAMAKKNMGVALGGDGGDELFMGYGHYVWRQRLEQLDQGPGRFLRKTAAALFRHMPSKYQRVAGLLNYQTIAEDWPHVWSQEQYMFDEHEVSNLLNHTYAHQTLRKSWTEIQAATGDAMLQCSLFDLKHYLPDDLLYKVDIASMAQSLEVRLPFLDHHLVEFAINLPASVKIYKDEQKYLLKQYLQKRFAKNFVQRPKRGFGTPVDQWLKGPLKGLFETQLNADKLKREGIFNPIMVSDLWSRYQKGENHLNKRIWALLVFQIWKEKYLP